MTNTNNTMTKPKQWLFENGHITEDKINQRGRLSRALVDIILDAVANGALIEGYEAVASTGPVENDAPVKVERVSIDPNKITDIGEPLRPKSSWTAYAYDAEQKKISVGLGTVDTTGCGNSLTYCGCAKPMSYVWGCGDEPVLVFFAPVK